MLIFVVVSLQLVFAADKPDKTNIISGFSYFPNVSTNSISAEIQEELTFYADEDSYIRGGIYANDNYGGEVSLTVKTGSSENYLRKTLVKFDLTNKGLKSVSIDKAILRLYANSAASCNIRAVELPDSWSESNVTWSESPTAGNSIISTSISSSDRYYEWDITHYVRLQIFVDEIISILLEDEGTSNVQVHFNSKEAYNYTPELVINTSPPTTELPNAPTSLTAMATSSSAIDIAWTDNANNEVGFKLERKEGDGTYMGIADFGANTISYKDYGLTNGTTYTYRLNSFNILGSSAYSNEAAATTELPGVYYVDAVNGNDNNDGKTPESAWKSLAKINSTTFSANESILFKAGDIWTGQLYPKGSGISGSPIVIDKYGTGNKPIIDGNGMTGTAVLYLYNQEYWEINNLEITNDGESAADRRGVRIEVDNYGTANHIYLKNLYVHNIKGIIGQDRSAKRTAGIGFGIINVSPTPSHFNDILVENCVIHTCDNQGIITECVSGDGFEPGTSEWEERKMTNCTIRNNTIYDISKNAMIIRCWEGGVVEYNVCYNTARGEDNAGMTGNTMFTAACRGTVFQFNEGYENQSPNFDGCMYDADLRSTKTIWQYSYSHDNAHGLFWNCTVQNDDSIHVRYNISQNDHGIIFCLNYAVNSIFVYNNTVFVGPGYSPQIISERNNGASGTRTYTFENNIIYNLGSASYDIGESGYTRTIDNNCFYGNHPSSEPTDNNKITADPKLLAPGTGGVGINSVDGYQLQEGSPCIDAGKTIPNNGGFDYWGNALTDSITDVGAHEFNGQIAGNTDIYKSNRSEIQKVKMYPIPLNQDILTINLSNYDLMANVNISITDSLGKTVYKNSMPSKEIIEINTNGILTKGLYCISLESGQIGISSKLIIQ